MELSEDSSLQYCHYSYYHEAEFDRDSPSLSLAESNPEDHIYEEIDSDSISTDEDTCDNFLLSISRERQRNLKFYGSAGWDFAESCPKS